MENLKINHAAVWVNVILIFALGFLWYDTLFGELWMEYVELDMATIEANPPGFGIWGSNIVATIVTMYMLAWLFVKLNIADGIKGAWTGFLIAFVFIFLTVMVDNMFAQNPYGLAWITGGFNVVGFTITGFIFGVWTKKEK